MKSSAAATQVGAAPFSNTLADTDRWGFDFNPTTDVLTVVNHLDQNFRVSPVDGTLVGADTALDNPGASEELNAIAYDRNFCSSTTTLYGYNYTTDSLVTIGGMNGSPSPTGGVITQLPAAKLNGANFSAGTRIGFDIAGGIGGPDTGYLTMRPQNGGVLKRYTIHLATAALSDLGTIGDGTRNFEGAAVRAEGIAPNISTDLKTATWRDLDGDFVTLKITKGALTAANFRMLGGGAQNTTALSKLTLTGEQFTGTNITITAKPSELGGDGKVNIGEINAVGVDLGAVKISGDLIAIDAGTAAAPAPSIKSLTVASMGSFGLNLLSGTASTSSTLEDGAGKINIAGDFHGFFNLGNHNTGSITIGGDVIGGTAAGRGGMANLTGNSTLGKLTIKGSIRAEDGSGAAQFLLQGVGSVVVGGDFVGGGADNSAYLGIDGTGKTSITIGGSVVGNTGTASALIAVSGTPVIEIKGSIISGDGSNSAGLTGFAAGTVIKSLTIGGSVVSNGEKLTLQAQRFWKIAISGSVIGLDGGSVAIVGIGLPSPANAAESIAIGGNLKNAVIAAGTNSNLTGNTADAAIGAVKIGGNMTASSIAAGIVPVNGKFGDSDDAFSGGNMGTAAIVARIASITIGGQLLGTSGGPADGFGILAEQIGALTIGKTNVPLTAAKNDLTLGFTGDVRVFEL